MRDFSLDPGNKPMGLKMGSGWWNTAESYGELFQHTSSPFPRESDKSMKLTSTLTPQQITRWSSLPSSSGVGSNSQMGKGEQQEKP